MLRLSAKAVALLTFFLTDYFLYVALLFAVTDGYHLSPLPLVSPWTAIVPLSSIISAIVAIIAYRATLRLAHRTAGIVRHVPVPVSRRTR